MDAPTTSTFNPLNLANRLAGIGESLDSMYNQSGLFKALMTPVNKVNLTAQAMLLENVAKNAKESAKHLTARQISILNKEISILQTKINILSGGLKENYPAQESFKESFAKATSEHEAFAKIINEYISHRYREDFMVNGKLKKFDEDNLKAVSPVRAVLREMIGRSTNLTEKESRQLSRLYTIGFTPQDLTAEKFREIEKTILNDFLTVGGAGASIFYQELQETTQSIINDIPRRRLELFSAIANEKSWKEVELRSQAAKAIQNLKDNYVPYSERTVIEHQYQRQIIKAQAELTMACIDRSQAADEYKTAVGESGEKRVETSIGDFDIV